MMSNSLPPWARIKQLPLEMVAGRDFQPGDTLYFSERAYPRILWTKLSDTSWSVLVERDNTHQRGQISIEPDVCYVVKRATPRQTLSPLSVHGEGAGGGVPGTRPENFFTDRPLTQIRCDGEYLEVGDVLYLDHLRGRAEILDIGNQVMSVSGYIRRARLNYLTQGKVAPYVFTGFHLQMFKLIAGPKFAAAQRDPARVAWMQGPNYWRWKG